MEKCDHGKSAPISVLQSLHDSQKGKGRHKCPVCAYMSGKELGESGEYDQSELIEHCQIGQRAPESILLALPDSQAGTGRHKCVICAFQRGLDTGRGLIEQAKSSCETEQITHGIQIEDYIADEEGRRRVRQHVVYERSSRNRIKAIEIHGTTCSVCGFNFDKVYGKDLAQEYIEIHHIRSVADYSDQQIDPETDLIPLCSNCYSMAHRRTGMIISIEDLKDTVWRARNI